MFGFGSFNTGYSDTSSPFSSYGKVSKIAGPAGAEIGKEIGEKVGGFVGEKIGGPAGKEVGKVIGGILGAGGGYY